MFAKVSFCNRFKSSVQCIQLECQEKDKIRTKVVP